MARYHRVEDIIQLALALQVPGPGLCLEEVQQRFGVGRRTAERMREAVERLYPGLTSRKGADGRKYWRLPAGDANGLVSWLPEEFTALDECIRDAEAAGNDGRLRALTGLRDKLRGLAHDPTAEPAPASSRERLDGPGSVLRRAIVHDREVELRVRQHSGGEATRVVHPHGMLGGARPKLVAFDPERECSRLHPLHTIASAEMTGRRFERRALLDIRRLATNALAPFEDGPVDVCWGFDADQAGEIAGYEFHPDQQVEARADGSTVVRFQADGIIEMAWHLFGFGDRVRALGAPILKSRFDTMMRRALDARARVLDQKDAFVSIDG